jgi:hypothetical protein
VLNEPGSRVHITYPLGDNPDDEAWLGTVASRHNGVLAGAMESYPIQRFARFETISDALAFVDELANSGRWRAAITRDSGR